MKGNWVFYMLAWFAGDINRVTGELWANSTMRDAAGFPSSTDTPFCRYPQHSRVVCPRVDFGARNLSIIQGGR